MTVHVITADVFAGLAQIPTDSVHACVTSPPYWQLRDYGFAGQIGLEVTVEEHVDVMVKVFAQVRRVLRPEGVLLLNYGDMWARDIAKGRVNDGGMGKHGYIDGERSNQCRVDMRSGGTLKPKDLVMMPERIALALQADGWWVRDRIIWHKPNPMPSSVTDRCTHSYEIVWHLAKSARYYWDRTAISEVAVYGTPNAPDKIKSETGQGFARRASMTTRAAVPPGAPLHRGLNGKNEATPDRRRTGFNERWDHSTADGAPLARNRRNVWTIPTEPYPGSHFATMPMRLAELCILASCPKGGVVLDPFGGAGTTGLVADRLQRNAILIEANAAYVAEQIMPRLAADRGGLLDRMEMVEEVSLDLRDGRQRVGVRAVSCIPVEDDEGATVALEQVPR